MTAWLTVITGTYIVYPWYRANPPEGLTDLSEYPRSYLLSAPNLAAWHTFGMEWKEHGAWFAPILATALAFVVWLRKMTNAVQYSGKKESLLYLALHHRNSLR